MKKCPHCGYDKGHYSTVTYTPIEGEQGNVFPRKPQKKVTEAYWFCHTCAKLVYETDKEFEPKE